MAIDFFPEFCMERLGTTDGSVLEGRRHDVFHSRSNGKLTISSWEYEPTVKAPWSCDTLLWLTVSWRSFLPNEYLEPVLRSFAPALVNCALGNTETKPNLLLKPISFFSSPSKGPDITHMLDTERRCVSSIATVLVVQFKLQVAPKFQRWLNASCPNYVRTRACIFLPI